MASTIQTRAEPFTRLLATNDATVATSIADPADTLSDPTGGTGVISLIGNQGTAGAPDVANGLILVPYGTDTSTQTFLMAVYGIRKINVATVGPAWTHLLLASFTCTLCTKAGIAGSPVNASQLYCGTITLTTGNANVSNEVLSPTGNNAAHVVLDVKGFQMVKVLFARNSSSASNNTLWARI